MSSFNLRLSYTTRVLRLPLAVSAPIHTGDALETDWSEVAPACNYIFGNPPFVGAKLQSQAKREQVKAIANLERGGGTLDYVSAWFIKAAEYVGAEGER